jgi:hypothetical protein
MKIIKNYQQWIHFAVTQSGYNITFYVNGVRDAVQTSSVSTYDSTFTSSGALSFTVGVWGTQTADLDLDEIRLYNRSLTAAEVLADFYSNGSLATNICSQTNF